MIEAGLRCNTKSWWWFELQSICWTQIFLRSSLVFMGVRGSGRRIVNIEVYTLVLIIRRSRVLYTNSALTDIIISKY